jgi:hypothetical protein
MGRLFLLARRQSRAFAVVELLGVVLLFVLGGLLLPNFAATGPAPTATFPSAEDASSTEPAILTDGSVRPIKFNINAGTFPQGDNTSDSQPVGADY